jgi:hypothetical protein
LVFDTRVLKQVLRTGTTGELVAKGVPGGFVLALRTGMHEDLLTAQRGGLRKFKRLEALASYLKDMGAASFTVELARWSDKSLI